MFYAASSHIFPDSAGKRQDEDTVPKPGNIYGITKYAGLLACRHYRETRNVFASCGILYNHESHLRPPSFISKKIALAAAKISRGSLEPLVLGNLDSKVDWGYAPDYVNAMHSILQLDVASDYVIASGQAHSVRQMVDIAFSYVGLNYQNHVIVAPNVLNGRDVTRIGDPSKLIADAGWYPTTAFESMVMKMVDFEVAGLNI
jgi:GDPmannose 4,6-dehydratase